MKIVIVDDEPILLKGLLKTYDWDQMGFQVVGTALSGEQAIEVIREKKPDVVLTDDRITDDGYDTADRTGVPVCCIKCVSGFRVCKGSMRSRCVCLSVKAD